MTPVRGAPLGDHLGPGVQPGGVVEVQFPKRSLRMLCERVKAQDAKGVGAPSHKAVNRSVRCRFKGRLKPDEIPYKFVYHSLLALGRDFRCQGEVPIEVNWRIVATEPVRGGIREGESGGESTVGNLIVVVGVTPTPEAAGGIWVPEGAVLEVRSICHKANLSAAWKRCIEIIPRVQSQYG